MIALKIVLTEKIIEDFLKKKSGVLTTKSALVCRDTYFGNDIIAPNSGLSKADSRGYVPVEIWIMSTIQAENPIIKEGEGITKINIDGIDTTLRDLKEIVGSLLFGDYSEKWPLTKVLDIGGEMVKTSFGTTETPPIPVHVHGGNIKNGVVEKPGKSEAYFFPPLNIPPYNKNLSVKTRIGLKAGVTKKDIEEKLPHFGKDDSMYELLNEFPIVPNSGWTVPEGVLHAPGPYLTFEIQRPQDDYNNASWKLGERLKGDELKQKYEEHVIRGLKNEKEVVEKVLDWEMTTDQELFKKYMHTPKLLDEGVWGKRTQIFFDQFYGEGWEILPGKELSLPEKNTPQAGIVWSGEGEINENSLSLKENNEFLLIPHFSAVIKNSGKSSLYIYTVEPVNRI